MSQAYEPGEEIELNLEGITSRKFYTKAMNWREQKSYINAVDQAKDEENETIETEELLKAIHTRIVRTDPPIGKALEDLEAVVDLRLIWRLHAAIKLNLSYEEKKSSELPH